MEATKSKGDERCVTQIYKPNIWSYNSFDSLLTDNVPVYASKAMKVKEEFICVVDKVTNTSEKLQVIDNICKLGLSNMFNTQITKFLDLIASKKDLNNEFIHNIEASALCFRLLRQHGYNNVQQGPFETTEWSCNTPNIKAIIKLYEASFLVTEDDNLLSEEDKAHLRQNLREMQQGLLDNQSLASQAIDTLGIPQHWRAQWLDVRQQIDAYELEIGNSSVLLKLAKLNFSMVQALHQQDLRDSSMWWRNLGLIEKIGFARDRLVESFVYALGIAPEPHYVCVRKCATKLINFILVIDDIYDVYGSVEELQCFTHAVETWNLEETDGFPECMKLCFAALYDSTHEIVEEIRKQNGFDDALPYITKAWADFCRSMLKEAQWEEQGYTPTLEEYISNAWISSSGSLLCLVVFLTAAKDLTPENLINELEEMRDLIYYTSLIIRLCNDEATTTEEIKRGDSPSSILCYMREAGVTEEQARAKIKDMISNTWKKINVELLRHSPVKHPMTMLIVNAARVAHCFYNTGDGFGDQDGDTKRQIKRMLFEPMTIE